MSKTKLFELYGFEVFSDSLYEVQEKKDSSAPDGYKDHNTTKDLSFDVEDGIPGAVFDSIKNIWDTGLTENSSYLARAVPNDTERNEIIKNLKKYIITPFEKIHGAGKLDFKNTPENDAYWLNYRIGLRRGKVFNTSRIEELLNLFFCLVFKRLTPKEMESHPSFKQPISSFIVVDKETSITRSAENEMKKMEATFAFMGMLNQKEKELHAILNSLGIVVSESTEKATLVRVFNNWLEDKTDKHQNTTQFLDAIEKYNTAEGKEYFWILGNLKDLQGKGVNFKQGEVYLQDVLLGNGWHNASEAVLKDKELKQMLTKIVK